MGSLWLPGARDRGAGTGSILEDASTWDTNIACCWARERCSTKTGIRPTGADATAHASLNDLMNDGDFLAAGRTIEQASGSHAIDLRCLLVNLKRYSLCGRPILTWARLAAIAPEAPTLEPGMSPSRWSMCDGSVGARPFAPSAPRPPRRIVDLVSPQGDAAPVAPYLAQGIKNFTRDRTSGAPLEHDRAVPPTDQVRAQVDGAKRGVFPWNLESYDDIDRPARRVHVFAVGACTALRRASSPIVS